MLERVNDGEDECRKEGILERMNVGENEIR